MSGVDHSYVLKLTEEFAADTNEITKRCPGVTSTGISIVSLRNEGFPTFYLCLTTGRHLSFTEKLRNLGSRRLFANSCCVGIFAIVAVSCMRL